MLTAADETCCYVNCVQAGVCVLTVADKVCCYENHVQAGLCIDCCRQDVLL